MVKVVIIFLPKPKRENLKSSTVCENQSIVPVFEFVKSASLFDEFAPRAKVKVEGVGENEFDGFDVGSDVFGVAEEVENEPFDSGFCPYRHKNRRLNFHSVQGDFADSGIAFLFENVEVEFWLH
jgi:hypothetical protein